MYGVQKCITVVLVAVRASHACREPACVWRAATRRCARGGRGRLSESSSVSASPVRGRQTPASRARAYRRPLKNQTLRRPRRLLEQVPVDGAAEFGRYVIGLPLFINLQRRLDVVVVVVLHLGRRLSNEGRSPNNERGLASFASRCRLNESALASAREGVLSGVSAPSSVASEDASGEIGDRAPGEPRTYSNCAADAPSFSICKTAAKDGVYHAPRAARRSP